MSKLAKIPIVVTRHSGLMFYFFTFTTFCSFVAAARFSIMSQIMLPQEWVPAWFFESMTSNSMNAHPKLWWAAMIVNSALQLAMMVLHCGSKRSAARAAWETT